MTRRAGNNETKSLSLMEELKRKLIHMGMLIIPLWIYLTEPPATNLGLIIASITTIALDVMRLSDTRLRNLFLRFFKALIRRHEEEHLLGSTYFMISALVSVFLFEEMIAISVLLFLVLGDTAAAVIGKKYGKPRYWDKSFEGSIACLVSCLIIGFILLDLHGGAHFLVLAGALVATLAEAIPLPLDDNMRVPLMSGLVMQLIRYFSQG